MKCFRLCLWAIGVLLSGACFAVAEDQPADQSSIKQLSSINATQIKLDNGMLVCLKPTTFEADEVYFKLGALGGYGALDDKDRPSGQIAAQAAWESGMGGMTSDQVSVFLYERSLEFEPKLLPFCRFIEGEGTKGVIGSFLQCVQMLFNDQAFTKEGWEAALSEMKTSISKEANDYDHVFDTQFLKLNTQSLPALKPMSVEDLTKADFAIAKEIFHRSFSDPSEFFFVIVGNFDVEQVSTQVKKYLGTIPRKNKGSGLNKAVSAPFPPGITKASIHLGKQPSSLTRLTFPLQVKVEEGNIYEIAFICQILEGRLKHAITEKMALSYGVDVSYEFPVYPYLNNPWVSIRFRSDEKDIVPIKTIILSELENLMKDGASSTEVEAIKALELGSQEFWLKDNFYLVSMLLNYYLWGWDPEKVDYKNTSIMQLTSDIVNPLLKQSISLTNYSEFTAFPESP